MPEPIKERVESGRLIVESSHEAAKQIRPTIERPSFEGADAFSRVQEISPVHLYDPIQKPILIDVLEGSRKTVDDAFLQSKTVHGCEHRKKDCVFRGLL